MPPLVDQLVAFVPTIPTTVTRNLIVAKQYTNVAINLWNVCIARFIPGVIDEALSARLRQGVLDVYNTTLPCLESKTSSERLMVMSMKTAKAHYNVGQHAMANKCLELSFKCCQKLISIAEANKSDISEIIKFRSIMVDCLLSNAQSSWMLQDQSAAMTHVLSAKDMLEHVPEKRTALAVLCRTFGTDSLEHNDSNGAVQWLCLSKKTLEEESTPENKLLLSKTLSYLTSALESMGGIENLRLACENALLAYEMDTTSQAYWIQYFKIVLVTHDQDENNLCKLIDNQIAGLTIDFQHIDRMLELADTLVTDPFLFPKAAVRLCQMARKRVSHSPDYAMRFLIKELIVCSINADPSSSRDRAVHEVLTEIATEVKRSVFVWNEKVFRELQHLLWGKARTAFEQRNFDTAIDWYEWAYKLLPGGDPLTASALLSNLAMSAMLAENSEKAQSYIQEKTTKYPNKVTAGDHMIKFKVYSTTGQHTEALSEFEKMCEKAEHEGNSVQEYLYFAAQEACEQKHTALIKKTLESLLKLDMPITQSLICRRCLLIILMRESEFPTDVREHAVNTQPVTIQAICEQLTSTYDVLSNKSVSVENIAVEAAWFYKKAWNWVLPYLVQYSAALPKGVNVDSVMRMDDVLMLLALETMCKTVFQIGSLVHTADNEVKQNMAMPMFMCSYISYVVLTHADPNDTTSIQAHARRVLQYLEQGFENIVESLIPQKLQFDLCLYKFSAHAALQNHSITRDIMESLPSRAGFEDSSSLLIDMAQIAVRFCAIDVSLSALSSALQIEMKRAKIFPDKCAKICRGMVDISLENNMHSEAMHAIKNATKIMSQVGKVDYPQMEVVWLIALTWNEGCRHFRMGGFIEAEKWMGEALEISEYLTNLENTYKPLLQKGYAEVLNKIGTYESTDHETIGSRQVSHLG
eukprot:CFRG5978T1